MPSVMQGTRAHRPNVRLNDEEKLILDRLAEKEERSASDILRRALKDYAKAQGASHSAARPKRSSLRDSA